MKLSLPLTVLFIFIFLFLSPVALYSQYEQETHINPTCDLCGGCRDAAGAETQPGDWERCRQCIYGSQDANAGPISGRTWTPIGCIGSGDSGGNAGGLVQAILQFVLAIAGGLTFLGILWGGFQLLTAGGDPMKVAGGKNTILAAGGAMLLIVFAVFLMQFIGYDILGIPGFGG